MPFCITSYFTSSTLRTGRSVRNGECILNTRRQTRWRPRNPIKVFKLNGCILMGLGSVLHSGASGADGDAALEDLYNDTLCKMPNMFALRGRTRTRVCTRTPWRARRSFSISVAARGQDRSVNFVAMALCEQHLLGENYACINRNNVLCIASFGLA